MQTTLVASDVHSAVGVYRDALGFQVDLVEGDPLADDWMCAANR